MQWERQNKQARRARQACFCSNRTITSSTPSSAVNCSQAQERSKVWGNSAGQSQATCLTPDPGQPTARRLITCEELRISGAVAAWLGTCSAQKLDLCGTPCLSTNPNAQARRVPYQAWGKPHAYFVLRISLGLRWFRPGKKGALRCSFQFNCICCKRGRIWGESILRVHWFPSLPTLALLILLY